MKEDKVVEKVEDKSMLETANETVKRLEEANRVQAELLDRKEEMMAKELLGGKSEAGQPDKVEFTEEEKASRARIKAVGDATGSPWAKNYE